MMRARTGFHRDDAIRLRCEEPQHLGSRQLAPEYNRSIGGGSVRLEDSRSSPMMLTSSMDATPVAVPSTPHLGTLMPSGGVHPIAYASPAPGAVAVGLWARPAPTTPSRGAAAIAPARE